MESSGEEKKTKRKYTTISIPVTLYNKLKEIVEETGFTSVSDYVTYILREVVAAYEESKKSEEFSPEEVERIKQKLKALGYL